MSSRNEEFFLNRAHNLFPALKIYVNKKFRILLSGTFILLLQSCAKIMITQLHVENFHIPSSSPPLQSCVLAYRETLTLRYSLAERRRGVSLAHCYFQAGF